jgi:hypothetical protein
MDGGAGVVMNKRTFTAEEIEDAELTMVACSPWRHGTTQTLVFAHEDKHWRIIVNFHHSEGWQIYDEENIEAVEVIEIDRQVKVWVVT